MNSRAVALLLSVFVCLTSVLIGNRAEANTPGIDLVSAVAADGVSKDALSLALGAVRCGVASGDFAAPKTLTVIDYSKPSTEPRLWVYDMATADTYVGHNGYSLRLNGL